MRNRSSWLRLVMLIICIQLIVPLHNLVQASAKPSALTSERYIEVSPEIMPGLAAPVDIFEDEFGIPHLYAKKLEDVYFMQGMLHARDRFFQMDVTRRTAEGRLAELIGAGKNGETIAMDVQLRALNLTRAVNESLSKLQPQTRKILKAYVKGVNAYLNANPLPAEYQALNLTQKRLWTETDTLLVGKALALSLSFDVGDITNTTKLQTYQELGRMGGFDGTALYFQDVNRASPFDKAFAIPDATGKPVNALKTEPNLAVQMAEQKKWGQAVERLDASTLHMAQEYIDKIRHIPILNKGTDEENHDRGSNWFVLSGKLTDSGFPIVNNDPHLSFDAPPIWYQIQLNVSKNKNKPPLLNVTGVSLAGVPGVVLGHNDNIAWAATTADFDVTDIYQEKIEAGFGNLSIINNGKQEPVEFRNEAFAVNQVTPGKMDNLVTLPPSDDIPARFPSIPRRNNGPIISINLAAKTALSIQYTGFGPTFEIETFLGFNTAKNIQDFQNALQSFDVGSQNFAVATVTGDIAFFDSGEVPLREDLQAGKVTGAPPFFIRDGSGGNEWMPVKKKQANQTLNYEILPFSELPQTINPSTGFVVTANNDQTGNSADNDLLNEMRPGGGIYYLGNDFANGSRAQRLTGDIKNAIQSGQKISVEMARRFQASVKMRDAEIFTPKLVEAFDNATQSGSPVSLRMFAQDPAIIEAITRFSKWDYSTPTGLRNGYDSFVPYNQSEPTNAQIDASVCATIYSLWRSYFVSNTIDKVLNARQVPLPSGRLALSALRNLMETFGVRRGTGLSGIFFFPVETMPNASPEAQRDFLMLQSLRDALNALAGPDFQMAFNNSTNQRDYRWGYLHRVVFTSALGEDSDFTIPSANGNFKSPFPGLFGIPRDGGLEVPNASNHDVRGKGINDFMFRSGPSKRQTIVLNPSSVESVIAIPGGQSSQPNSKFHDNLLSFWLTADVYALKALPRQSLTKEIGQMRTFYPAKEGAKKE